MISLITVIAFFTGLNDAVSTRGESTVIATIIIITRVSIITCFYADLHDAIPASSLRTVVATAVMVVSVAIIALFAIRVHETIATECDDAGA